MNFLAVWAGWPFTANYQTSTGSDTGEREGAPTPYGKPTKPRCPHNIAHVAFMPKVSAPTCKQRLVRLVSTTQDPAHNKIIKHTHTHTKRLPKNTARSTLSVDSLSGAWASGYGYLSAAVPR